MLQEHHKGSSFLHTIRRRIGEEAFSLAKTINFPQSVKSMKNGQTFIGESEREIDENFFQS